MTRTRTRTSTGLLLAITALAVAGCGGSTIASHTSHQPSAGPAQTTAASPPATTTQPQTTTGASTTPASTTTTTSNSGGVPVSGGPACTAGDLTPAYLNSNGATGHVVTAFTLTNSSSSSCHTYGYPGVLFLSRSGIPLTTNATRTTIDFAGQLPEDVITLAPGQKASFRMVTSDVGSSQSDCATAHALQIIAPDDTATMKVSISEPITFCDGHATVSPLVAGTGASST